MIHSSNKQTLSKQNNGFMSSDLIVSQESGLSLVGSAMINAERCLEKILDLDNTNVDITQDKNGILSSEVYKHVIQNKGNIEELINNSNIGDYKLSAEVIEDIKIMLNMHSVQRKLTAQEGKKVRRTSQTSLDKNQLSLKTKVKFKVTCNGYNELLKRLVIKTTEDICEDLCSNNIYVDIEDLIKERTSQSSSFSIHSNQLRECIRDILSSIVNTALENGMLVSDLNTDFIYQKAYDKVIKNQQMSSILLPLLPLLILVYQVRLGDGHLKLVLDGLCKSKKYRDIFEQQKSVLNKNSNLTIDASFTTDLKRDPDSIKNQLLHRVNSLRGSLRQTISKVRGSIDHKHKDAQANKTDNRKPSGLLDNIDVSNLSSNQTYQLLRDILKTIDSLE